jgi:hypothetical protein
MEGRIDGGKGGKGGKEGLMDGRKDGKTEGRYSWELRSNPMPPGDHSISSPSSERPSEPASGTPDTVKRMNQRSNSPVELKRTTYGPLAKSYHE